VAGLLEINGANELTAAVGSDLGRTDWVLIDQTAVDQFAAATGDGQWIHVDVDRAVAGPFGSTIAHGYLTLALIPRFHRALFTITGFRLSLNYGLNRVRFPSPLHVGTKIRMGAVLKAATANDTGFEVTSINTFIADGIAKPICMAESIVRLIN
jgi:acyl dehydratase